MALRRTARAAPAGWSVGRVIITSTGQPPSCNTGVVNHDHDEFYAWDWTQTTHPAIGSHTVVTKIVKDLTAALDGTLATPGKGLQGWSDSVQVFDRDGYKRGQVYWGGNRTDVHVVSTSAVAHSVRHKVVGLFDARTSRVDTCMDTLIPYEELVAILHSAAGRKAITRSIHSHNSGESTGRTLYLGSSKSTVQVRLYEKWLQAPGQYPEGTNRVEVQLRPPSRSKAMVSGWSPTDTFCATELTRRVARALPLEESRPPTMQKKRGTPDLERTMFYMAQQYGPGVERWLQATGGEVGTVLDYMLNRKVAAA